MAPKKKAPGQKRGLNKEEQAEADFQKMIAERAAKNAPPAAIAKTPASSMGGIGIIRPPPQIAQLKPPTPPASRSSTGGMARVTSAASLVSLQNAAKMDPQEEEDLLKQIEEIKSRGGDASSIKQLAGLMAKPSKKAQAAAADAVAGIAAGLDTDERVSICASLMNMAISEAKESVEGEKRGYAIGAAAVCRATGTTGLEDLNLLPPIREILAAKKASPVAREAAAWALDGFARALGRRFEPAMVEFVKLLLPVFMESNLTVRAAAIISAGTAVRHMTPQGAQTLLPEVVKGIQKMEKWQMKSGCLELLLAFCSHCPRQMCDSLPEVYPGVLELLNDTHPQVKEASLRVLPDVCKTVAYPEVKNIVDPYLLNAIIKPTEELEACLDAVLDITFVNAVDAPALAVLMPIVTRGLRGTKAFLKNSAAKIVGNMCALVMFAKDLAPYTPMLLPELLKLIVDSSPDVRLIAAKAVASLVMGMGGPLMEEFLPEITKMQEKMTTIDKAEGRRAAGNDLQAMVETEVKKATEAVAKEATEACGKESAMAHIREAFAGAIPSSTPAWVSDYGAKVAAATLSEEVADSHGEDLVVASLCRSLQFLGLEEGEDGPLKELCSHVATEYLKDTGVEVAHDDRIVNLNGIILAFASRVLLQRTHLHMDRGHVYGLVGQNGVGKTTLMTRVAQGDIHNFPTHLKCVYVQHEVHRGNRDAGESVYDFMMAELPKEGGESIRSALDSVGFSRKMQDSPVADLSGGWRMKLAIARAMLQRADILLLDEPTNHLDVASIAWLAEYVTSLSQCTVMLVSHDQQFMSKVVTDVIHIHDRKLTYYNCGFSEFREQNPVLYLEATNLAEEEKKGAGRARAGEICVNPEKDDRVLAAVEHTYKEDVYTSQPFFFPNPGKLDGIKSKTKPVLTMDGVSFTYPGADKPTLTDVNCKIAMGSRIAILGANGAGKTTMMKMLVGESVPDDGVGEVWKHHSLRLSYVAQHSMHHLEKNLLETPVKYLQVGGIPSTLDPRPPSSTCRSVASPQP